MQKIKTYKIGYKIGKTEKDSGECLMVLLPTTSVEINQKVKKVTPLIIMSLVFMIGLTFERLGKKQP